MDKNTMIAYAQVDTIIEMMDEEYVNKIPKKLRTLIKQNKLEHYDLKIDPNIPFADQNISRKAIAILSVLNYNYWCTDEEEKRKMVRLYKDNEEKKYNPDLLFNNKSNVNQNQQLIVYNKKENIFRKIIKKLKKIIKKNDI